jgi:hypothetical protein
VGRDSSFGIATRYGLDGPIFKSRWGASFFRTRPDRPWGLPSLLYSGYRVSFPGVKRPGRGVDHPPSYSARVKERVELFLYSPSGPSWPVVGRPLPLPLIKTADLLRFLYHLSGSPPFLIFWNVWPILTKLNINVLSEQPHTFQLLESVIRTWRTHKRTRQQLNARTWQCAVHLWQLYNLWQCKSVVQCKTERWIDLNVKLKPTWCTLTIKKL